MYEILLHPDAQKVYAEADKALAKKIAKCLQQLEQDPRSHPNIKALKGEYSGLYRYRIGDYRVIYSVEDLQQKPAELLSDLNPNFYGAVSRDSDIMG